MAHGIDCHMISLMVTQRRVTRQELADSDARIKLHGIPDETIFFIVEFMSEVKKVVYQFNGLAGTRWRAWDPTSRSWVRLND